MRPELPTGTVTFLFTDIEGSTQLLQRLGDSYASLLAVHRRILTEAITNHHGNVVDTQGDSFFAVFPRAMDALYAAIEAQRTLATHDWQEGVDVRVRMALHTGEPLSDDSRYVGMDVHRAARIGSAGHGGQVLVSQTTRDLVEQQLPKDIGIRDLGYHQLKDLPHPEPICQLVITGLPSAFPPLKTPTAFLNNLPVQLTSFIGRGAQISEIKRLVGTRHLLTLTGVGGTGKTRLALQAAKEALGEFQDGIWFVEFAPISDPSHVPDQVASTLGIREVVGRSFLELLKEYLHKRSLLLILDNCEHLLEAIAQLADALLRAAPDLKILATSREALGIAGETTFPVPSLSCPAPLTGDGGTLAGEDITRYEAVQLFLDRALAVHPQFQLTSRNGPAVARICSRLDGIPLALELAAARVKGLSAEQIASHLDDRFRLLTGGSRTALPRQRTLLAAVDWSYNLLSDHERVLLRRLAVFSGSWTLEAAEFVCAGNGLERTAILDLLLRLVDKSLVVADVQLVETRHRMLETIRQYAQEKLAESAEIERLRDQHLEYYLNLAKEADSHLLSDDQPQWIECLEGEFDNLRSALSWATEGQKRESGVAFAAALSMFWTHTNHCTEGRERLTEFLASAGPALSIELRARLLFELGWLSFWVNDYSGALPYLEECVMLCREVGDKRTIAEALNMLGATLSDKGDLESARRVTEEALALRLEFDDPYYAANTMVVLAGVNWQEGNIDEARRLFKESVVIKDRLGRLAESHYPLIHHATLELEQGELQEAERLLRRGLDILSKIIDKRYVPIYIQGFAVLAERQGKWTRAAILLGAAERWLEKLYIPREIYVERLCEQTLRRLHGALDKAIFDAAYAEGYALTMEQALAFSQAES